MHGEEKMAWTKLEEHIFRKRLKNNQNFAPLMSPTKFFKSCKENLSLLKKWNGGSIKPVQFSTVMQLITQESFLIIFLSLFLLFIYRSSLISGDVFWFFFSIFFGEQWSNTEHKQETLTINSLIVILCVLLWQETVKGQRLVLHILNQEGDLIETAWVNNGKSTQVSFSHMKLFYYISEIEFYHLK